MCIATLECHLLCVCMLTLILVCYHCVCATRCSGRVAMAVDQTSSAAVFVKLHHQTCQDIGTKTRQLYRPTICCHLGMRHYVRQCNLPAAQQASKATVQLCIPQHLSFIFTFSVQLQAARAARQLAQAWLASEWNTTRGVA